MKTRKKENMEIENFLHKFPSNRRSRNDIHSLLRRADARGALTSFTVCAGQAYRYCRHKVGHAKST